MAIEQHQLTAHERPISELDGYRVEAGDTDPRGWNAVGENGDRIGHVVDLVVDTDSMKVRKLVIDRDDETATNSLQPMLVDIDGVDLREGSREVCILGYGLTQGGLTTQAPEATELGALDDSKDGARDTLTRSEEELRIGKRPVIGGEVRIGKHVRTAHVSQPVTKLREEVVIERRPVASGVELDTSISEGEVRIPVMAEEIVVEKRAVVKEELVISKRIVEDREIVNAELKREEFDIDDNVDEVGDGGAPRNRGGRE